MKPTFTDLIEGLKNNQAGTWSVEITENWLQGRTTYGGLSAALCLAAVGNTHPNLPPLRSAQINFVGPAGGPVTIKSEVMRQGRSVTYISAEMHGEKGLATHAVFCFGTNRNSRLDGAYKPTPVIPLPEQSESFFGEFQGPVFTQNFECLLAKGARPVSRSEEPEHFIWARYKEPTPDSTLALLGIADMPPPAVLPMFQEFAPVSSMTWMLNFLIDQPTTRDGWWLMRTDAEHARDGYSSQDMSVYNTDGDLVITGRQSVAIFY